MPEDIDTAGEDHIYDETRYFLMSRPIAPRKRSAGPRGLGGDFEFLPLKSPRNPITPIETSRVVTLHPGLYKRLREGARRVIGATAKPLYEIDGKGEGLDRRNPLILQQG